MSQIRFTVNGKKCSVNSCLPRNTTLNAYLRYVLCLPGTKAMCLEGGCGACIVMVKAKRYPSNTVETFSVNSCLVLIFSCDGWEITTIEGVGNRIDGYSDVQKRIAAFNGTQCGYCTPGWVMHMSSLKHKNLSMAQLEKSFGSNTCRCTGFRPILDTMKSFASDASLDLCQRVKDIEDLQLCKTSGKKCNGTNCTKKTEISDDILDDFEHINNIICLDFGITKYYKVYEENDVFNLLDKLRCDSYMLVDGNTGKGIYEDYQYPQVLFDISDVQSLKTYNLDQNLILGANISLEDCIEIFKRTAEHYAEFSYLAEFVKHFELIAHIPVRKIGSLAGNIMLKHANPDYQSDVFLLFEAVGAAITIKDRDARNTTMRIKNFLKLDMKYKLIVKIHLPPYSESHVFRSYKIMPRNQNALAIVNAAFLIKMNKDTNKVEDARIVYGNISASFIHAEDTEKYIIGKNIFTNKVLQEAVCILFKEIEPVKKPPEISPDIRRKLAIGLFYKCVLSLAPSGSLCDNYRSGGQVLDRPISKGIQDFQTDPSLYPLNQPVQKLEAQIQSAGEAQYVNDIPPSAHDVFGAFVMSTVCRGEVESIDVEGLKKIEGFLTLYTAKDFPGKNSFGFPGIQLQTEDEEILATTIKFYGQPIAIVVAETQALAARLAKHVEVKYKRVNKDPVLTITNAMKDSTRLIPGEPKIEPKGKGDDVKKVIKGVYTKEAQYHYYLEPLSCVVIPVDRGLEVYDSTQWVDLTQIAVAQCLDIKESDLVVVVRRLGGGFGGKISRNVQVACACALVAKKMNRTCRFILPIQTNLTIAGRRLPTRCEYEVGVNDDGKIQYLDASIIQDAGCSNNENILEYVTGGFPNCYDSDYFSLKTAVVLTDLPSNTFARAPGTAESISSIEHIMEHIAYAVNKDPTAVRELNMRTDDNDLPSLIQILKDKADYNKRVEEIEQFNKCNRWRKKAVKIGVMSFPVIYYGNYSALVSIYRGDGTVTVTTGGIEMGQGSNTKALQVCAYELGIPLEYVSIIPTYSFTSANNVFSGSSITSECICFSIIKACGILKERLAPIKKELKDATWTEIIKKAGDELIDLTASYMMTDKEEELSGYNAYGVVILEAELDCLTGRYQMNRVDILEDVGLSANPNIDVGQVEGAFIQGCGYFTSEKFVYDTMTGKLLTNRSLTYHVPLCLDIPVQFNVHLRYNSKNPKGVLGSKTCGEMGICLAHTINHALRQCIYESRKDSGYDITEWIDLTIPYDTESILRALAVENEEFLISKR